MLPTPQPNISQCPPAILLNISQQLLSMKIYPKAEPDKLSSCPICNEVFTDNVTAEYFHIQSDTHKRNMFERHPPLLTVTGFTVKLDFDVIIDYFKQFGELKYIEGNYMTFILYIVYVDESLVLDSIASQDHMFNCEKLHIQSHSAAVVKNQSLHQLDDLDDSCTIANIIDSSLNRETPFSEQIEVFLDKIRSGNSSFALKYPTVLNDLIQAICSVYPQAQVYTFGSLVTGLCLFNKSLEFYVANIPTVPVSKQEIKSFDILINNLLNLSPKFRLETDRFFVFGEKSLHHEYRHIETSVECDIKVKNSLSFVSNSQLIDYYLGINEKFRTVMLLLKFACKMEKTKLNTFSIPGLIMMFIFYLQHKPYCLPSVKQLQSDSNKPDWNYSFTKIPIENDSSINAIESATILDILIGFFRFYANVDFFANIISPFLGRFVPKTHFNSTIRTLPVYKLNVKKNHLQYRTFICVQDPFILNKNVTISVSKITLSNLINFCKLWSDKNVNYNDFLFKLIDVNHICFSTHMGCFKYVYQQWISTDRIQSISEIWSELLQEFIELILTDIMHCQITKLSSPNNNDNKNNNEILNVTYRCVTERILFTTGRKNFANNLSNPSLSTAPILFQQIEISRLMAEDQTTHIEPYTFDVNLTVNTKPDKEGLVKIEKSDTLNQATQHIHATMEYFFRFEVARIFRAYELELNASIDNIDQIDTTDTVTSADNNTIIANLSKNDNANDDDGPSTTSNFLNISNSNNDDQQATTSNVITTTIANLNNNDDDADSQQASTSNLITNPNNNAAADGDNQQATILTMSIIEGNNSSIAVDDKSQPNNELIMESTSADVVAAVTDDLQSKTPVETDDNNKVLTKPDDENSSINNENNIKDMSISDGEENVARQSDEKVDSEDQEQDSEEDDEDVPADFFDIFSDQDFMAGLDIVDAWDDDSKKKIAGGGSKDDSTTKRTGKREKIVWSPSGGPRKSVTLLNSEKNRRERRTRSPLGRRRPYRSRSRSLGRRSRSMSYERRRADRLSGAVERRDPEKTNRDIKRDKLRCAKDKEQKIVSDKLKFVETGLVPPGTEMDIDIATMPELFRNENNKKRELNTNNNEDKAKIVSGRRLTRRSKSRDLRRRSKSRDFIRRSKSRELLSRRSKSRDLLSRRSKSRDLLSRRSKSRDLLSRRSKSRDLLSRRSKSRELSRRSKSRELSRRSKSRELYRRNEFNRRRSNYPNRSKSPATNTSRYSTKNRGTVTSPSSNISDRELWIRDRRRRKRSLSRDSLGRMKQRKYESSKQKSFLEEIRDKLNEVKPTTTTSTVNTIQQALPQQQYNMLPNMLLMQQQQQPTPVPPPNPYFVPAVTYPNIAPPQQISQRQQYDKEFFIGGPYPSANNILQQQIGNVPLTTSVATCSPVDGNTDKTSHVLPLQLPIINSAEFSLANNTSSNSTSSPIATISFPSSREKKESAAKRRMMNDNKHNKPNNRDVTVHDVDKLFVDKKISLSDFLSITAKPEVNSTSPDQLQKKVKVISRCQDVIKMLSNDKLFAGRLVVDTSKANSQQQQSKGNGGDIKFQSPLRKIPIVRFQYTTTPAKSLELSDPYATILDKILKKIGVLREVINLDDIVVDDNDFGPSASSSKSNNNKTISSDNDKVDYRKKNSAKKLLKNSSSVSSSCEECKKRKLLVYTEVGTQCVDKVEMCTISTQVVEDDLNPPKGLLKGESIAALTPAQLLSKEKNTTSVIGGAATSTITTAIKKPVNAPSSSNQITKKPTATAAAGGGKMVNKRNNRRSLPEYKPNQFRDHYADAYRESLLDDFYEEQQSIGPLSFSPPDYGRNEYNDRFNDGFVPPNRYPMENNLFPGYNNFRY